MQNGQPAALRPTAAAPATSCSHQAFRRHHCLVFPRLTHALRCGASSRNAPELNVGSLSVSAGDFGVRNSTSLNSAVAISETAVAAAPGRRHQPSITFSNGHNTLMSYASTSFETDDWATRSSEGNGAHRAPSPLEDVGFEALLDAHMQPLSQRQAAARSAPPGTTASKFIDVIAGKPSTVSKHFNTAARNGEFQRALSILEACVAANRHDIITRFNQKYFLHTAAKKGAAQEAMRFVQLLPRAFADARTHNMMLHVCAKAKDLKTALAVVTLMDERGIKIDTLHYTTLISVCSSVGNVDRALRLFQDLKLAKQRPDSQAYGALFAAFANAIERDIRVNSDKREQLVLLERAFHMVDDASNSHLLLEVPVWNSLITLAGRSNQLDRAFQVIDMMQVKGLKPDSTTYGALMTACIRAKESEMALRLYKKALSEGHTGSRELYTLAINACMKAEGGVDVDGALEIYSFMQRNHVEPDDVLYGNLIAAAGKAGRMNLALDILNDMLASNLRPGKATCSALLHACLCQGNLAVAKRVYTTLKNRGVFPSSAQYNALMAAYARAFR